LNTLEIHELIEGIILTIHRRNGGHLKSIDFNSALMAPELILDSLDLAEIFSSIEKQICVDFFNDRPPRIWKDVVEKIESKPSS